VEPEVARRWLPVDQYTGGAEHAVMHLLYARFFWKAIRDMGLVHGDEPFLRLFNQGQILGPDGQRMSKSRGNVVAPDEQVARYGADVFRLYLMFIGPWDQGAPFSLEGIAGVERWMGRVWNLVQSEPRFGDEAKGSARNLRHITHKTICRATEDIEHFRFNTMIAALMEMTNAMTHTRDDGPVDTEAWREAVEALLLMLAPLAPHITEELWERSGRPYSVHRQSWPNWDEQMAREALVTLVVQVNGKVRDRIEVPADIDEARAKELPQASPLVQRYIEGKEIKRVIYVPGKLVNIVVG
jgi:leucyl-tRNA synthetase